MPLPSPPSRVRSRKGSFGRAVLAGWFSGLFVFAGSASAFYGDIELNRTARQFGAPFVVFPHWIHRTEFMCSVCHPDIFPMEANTRDMMMEKMVAQKSYCSTCHNGTIAWKPVNCTRCHRVDERFLSGSDADATMLPEPGPPFAKDNRDPSLVLRNFPRDLGGNIDWIQAVRNGLITPRPSLKSAPSGGASPPADIIMPRTGHMSAVLFPHASHALWLECKNCHPTVFVAEKGSNPVSMDRIRAGEFCGRCHGKVAFPLSACERCHR